MLLLSYFFATIQKTCIGWVKKVVTKIKQNCKKCNHLEFFFSKMYLGVIYKKSMLIIFFLIVFLKVAQLLLFNLIFTDLFFVKYFTVILENLGKIL